MMKRHLATALLLFMVALPSWATFYTVGPSETYTDIGTTLRALLAPGDVVEFRAATGGGTYTHTEDVVYTSDDNVTFRGRDGDTINWTPATSFCIDTITNGGDGWKFVKINFLSTGTSVHSAIRMGSTGIASVEVDSCSFSGLRTGIFSPGGNYTGSITVTNTAFDTPQANVGGAGSWAIGGNTGGNVITIDNCTFDDTAGAASPTWLSAVTIYGGDGSSITNSVFTGRTNTDKDVIRVSHSDQVTIEDNYFSGFDATVVELGLGLLATDNCEDVVIQRNRMAGLGAGARGVGLQAESTLVPSNFHRRIVVRNNVMEATEAGSSTGVYLLACSDCQVSHNEIRDFGGSGSSSIAIGSTRRSSVFNNRSYNADNHIVLYTTGALSAYHNFDVELIENYMQDDGADAAVKIDHSTGSGGTPAFTVLRQDSSLTMRSNIYNNVAITGRNVWTDGLADFDWDAVTLSAWQDTLIARYTQWGFPQGEEFLAQEDPSDINALRVLEILPKRRKLGSPSGLGGK